LTSVAEKAEEIFSKIKCYAGVTKYIRSMDFNHKLTLVLFPLIYKSSLKGTIFFLDIGRVLSCPGLKIAELHPLACVNFQLIVNFKQ
jgi:hypothetical protein